MLLEDKLILIPTKTDKNIDSMILIGINTNPRLPFRKSEITGNEPRVPQHPIT
jgi:hypothetical protein